VAIHYLNTDLDLVADHELDALVDALEATGLTAVHHFEVDGRFRAGLELADGPGAGRSGDGGPDPDRDAYRPQTTIAGMLDCVERLDPAARAAWDGCAVREFNIGYECGDTPWAFHQGLDNALLARVAGAGAGLRITLYPTAAEGADPEDDPGAGDFD
jgi:hypothetical protein